MSSTALEIDTPQLRASQLIAHPGTLPTITIPVLGQAGPDLRVSWRYLAETADFFAVPMPTPAELSAAISAYLTGRGAGPTALDVTIAVADGAAQILVSGTPVRTARDAVRISVDDSVPHAHRVTDPWWRRMAARTTSRGDVDQLQRWLNSRGLADCVSDGVPHLGALVFELGDGELVAVENPEPTSILGQLHLRGAMTVIERIGTRPDARRAWWISPRYEVHPVAEIDGTRCAVDAGVVPPFVRWT